MAMQISSIAYGVFEVVIVAIRLLLCLAILNVIYITLYNLYLHPLRKFPGPKLAAITPYYWTWKILIGQKHTYAKKWHEQYGEVVRVQPNELSFIGESAWKDIYAHKQGRGQMQKFGRVPPGTKVYNILNAPDNIHARQRKMLSHAFSDRALREQESILKTYIDLLMSNLHEDAKNKVHVDIVTALNWATFDIIGDLSFAESFHNLELRHPHIWLSTILRSIRIGVAFRQLNTLPGFSFFLNLLQNTLRNRIGFDFLPYTKTLIDKRIKQGTARPDFMSRVLENNREDGTGITRDEIDATMAMVVIGGSETTSTLLAGCVYLLLRNPEKMSKLREEILSEFNRADDITIASTSRLPYLFAVLEESLRIYPPVPVALSRIVPPEGASICGYWVHGGTIVGIPQHAAYHSVSNFAKPDDFIPERWLPDKDEIYNNDRTAIFQPFSTGPRNCVGKNLAYAEMNLILTRLLFEFEFELEDERYDWINQRVFTLWEKPPLLLRPRERAT